MIWKKILNKKLLDKISFQYLKRVFFFLYVLPLLWIIFRNVQRVDVYTNLYEHIEKLISASWKATAEIQTKTKHKYSRLRL